jgi:DNA-directed RNA polymerase omega subunit
MLDFDIDKCLKVVPNKYDLILLAKSRAYEILAGSQPLVPKGVNEKPFFSVLKEISNNCFTYNELNDKARRMIRNQIFGIFTEQIKPSVDQFDDSSIFAKSFSGNSSSEKIELEDLLNETSGNSENYENNSNIKMIGSFENFDEESLSDFSDGLEIFENEDFRKSNNESSEE